MINRDTDSTDTWKTDTEKKKTKQSFEYKFSKTWNGNMNWWGVYIKFKL